MPHVTPAEVPDAVRGAFAGLPRVLRRHEGRLYTEPGLLSAIFHAIGSVRARTDSAIRAMASPEPGDIR